MQRLQLVVNLWDVFKMEERLLNIHFENIGD